MSRSRFYFVALCMVLIAMSAGAVGYISFKLSVAEALVVMLGGMLAMILGHMGSMRAADRTAVDLRLQDLSRLAADIAHRVDDLGRRVERVEINAMDKARAVAEPITAEVDALGTIVRQFAETLQAHETAIMHATTLAAAQASVAEDVRRNAEPVAENASAAAETVRKPAALAQAAPEPVKTAAARPSKPASDAPPAPRAVAGVDPDGPLAGLSETEATQVVRNALTENRLEVYLQPIVTLPQRKVRWYEALCRLRGDDGALLSPSDFMAVAEQAQFLPALDNLVVYRAVQIVRRLSSKNRDVGVVCNVSGMSIVDPTFAQNLLSYMDANRALAGALMFEMTQESVAAMSPIEIETMRALSQLGFRFSMDHVSDLQVDPRDLAERGFRYLKVRADVLLTAMNETRSDIHPADLANLLRRHDIELIVEHIEHEPTVADLLDYDVRFGQGFLFSRPRPVRADVLGGAKLAAEDIVAPDPILEPEPAAEKSRTTRGPRSAPAKAPAASKPIDLPQDTVGAAVLANASQANAQAQRRAAASGPSQALRTLARKVSGS